MIPPLETYVVVSLAFAVFAAVTSVGAAIVLGVGYERLRAGLERVKEGLDVLNRQTGFFSTAIFKLENRVDAIDPALIKPVSDEAPAKTRKSAKTKSPAKGRGKKSVTHIDDLPSASLTAQDKGDITVSVSAESANDWHSYQGLSRDEALANFAQGGPADGKVRFM